MTLRLSDPDAEIIEQIRAGQKEAFENIVMRYNRRVYAVAYRYVNNSEEAADITQEIFIRVWEKLETFRGDSKFSTWLFQLAGNHCKNKLKALKRRRWFQNESLNGHPRDDDYGPARQHESPDPGPGELLSGARMQEMVRNKLEELPEDQRTVLMMRDIDDLDYDEIAEATGLALGTVKSRIHRGRIELAKRIKREMADEAV